MPKYVSSTTEEVDASKFFWASRLIAALADASFGTSIIFIERYQNESLAVGHQHILEWDKKYQETKDPKVLVEANETICKAIKKITDKTLKIVLGQASLKMKNGYLRFDN